MHKESGEIMASSSDRIARIKRLTARLQKLYSEYAELEDAINIAQQACKRANEHLAGVRELKAQNFEEIKEKQHDLNELSAEEADRYIDVFEQLQKKALLRKKRIMVDLELENDYAIKQIYIWKESDKT